MVFVDGLAQLVPGRVLELRLETFALETCVAQLERCPPLCAPHNIAQSALHQFPQGDSFARRDFPRFEQQGIRNLDRGFHIDHPYGSNNMGTHIIKPTDGRSNAAYFFADKSSSARFSSAKP